jgi:two-component sensor histidine kinase/PAS domain-containing protein
MDDASSIQLAMGDAVQVQMSECARISDKERDRLLKMARDMPFVADVSRSDFLLYARCNDRDLTVIAQARPRSIMPIHADNLVGDHILPEDEKVVFQAFWHNRTVRGSRRLIDGGAPVIQKVWPIRGEGGRVIAALSVEANLIAHVRQKSRSSVFQRAVHILQRMLLLGELKAADSLSPFREHDGIIVADSQGIIRYMSGIATDHYRKLGYMDSLIGRHLSTLDTGDQMMFWNALRDLQCHEKEFTEHPYLRMDGQRTWIRKAVPLVAYPWGQPWWEPWEWFHRRPVGALFTIHDATEERRKERELKIKSAMIQEVHHRVKNNLQTVAAMLRMQIRRSENEEARQILQDSVSRILSMAVVHEFLSREEGQAINVREVTQRIIQQVRQAILSPEKQIRIVLDDGHNLYLPARQATACALVINELLQNAVEHGYDGRNAGTISVRLEDEGDQVCITITDDGEGLPPDFDLEQTGSLGLQIVQTLVQDDLRGGFEMKNTGGVQATIRFSKRVLEGEEHWNGQE